MILIAPKYIQMHLLTFLAAKRKIPLWIPFELQPYFLLLFWWNTYLAFRERLHTPSLNTLDITCSSPDVQHCNVSGHQSPCSHVVYIYCDGACKFKLVLSVGVVLVVVAVIVVIIPFLLYNFVIVKVKAMLFCCMLSSNFIKSIYNWETIWEKNVKVVLQMSNRYQMQKNKVC